MKYKSKSFVKNLKLNFCAHCKTKLSEMEIESDVTCTVCEFLICFLDWNRANPCPYYGIEKLD